MSTNIYNSFINENVAPYSANSIGVFNSNGEQLILTESGSNNRPQLGSSSSYTSGTIFIKIKFKLKFE